MYQLIAPVVLIILLLLSPTSHSSVGKVTEQTGPTEIVRSKKSIESKVNASVEMNDTIVTAKSRAQITFEDNTTVKITEQSKLIIDDFVYDPKKGSGKVAMKVVLGTARYASGQIAKNNPQSVDVKTPTATIAVRGTDFSMTVDELGRSLVMLLPSCDDKGCVTGAIMVSNESGSVLMDVAYQATLVSSLNIPPSRPVIVTVDPSNINNLLIVTPPKEVEKEEIKESKSALDVNFLNVDLLKYNALDEDELKKFVELDINLLDTDLLGNILDIQSAALSTDMLSNTNRLLPDYSEAKGIRYFFNDDGSKITLNRTTTHTASVTLNIDEDKTVDITQDGVFVTQNVNKGGSTTIIINQR
jgi:hypothetical protein